MPSRIQLKLAAGVAAVAVIFLFVDKTALTSDDSKTIAISPSDPNRHSDINAGPTAGTAIKLEDIDWSATPWEIGISLRRGLQSQTYSEIQLVDALEECLARGIISEKGFQDLAVEASAAMVDMQSLLRLLVHFESGEGFESIAKRAFSVEPIRDLAQIERLNKVLDDNMNDQLRNELLSLAAQKIEYSPNFEKLVIALLQSSSSSNERSAVYASLASSFAIRMMGPNSDQRKLSRTDTSDFGGSLYRLIDEGSKQVVGNAIGLKGYSEDGLDGLKQAASSSGISEGALISAMLSNSHSTFSESDLSTLLSSIDTEDPQRMPAIMGAAVQLLKANDRSGFNRAIDALPISLLERSQVSKNLKLFYNK